MRFLLVLLFFTSLYGQVYYCDKDILINLTTQPNASYNWNINGFTSTEQDATLVVNRTGIFIIELEITNEYGCTSIDKKTLMVEDCNEWTYYAPNAFVPDGVNKTWTPIGSNITIDRLMIWTRDGQLIYEGLTAWDGLYKNNECMGGVYVFTCNYTTIDGQKKFDTGTVTLVR